MKLLSQRIFPVKKRRTTQRTAVPEGASRVGRPICIDKTLLMFLAAVVIVVTAVHEAGDARFDFGVFYYAARMVWDGARASLYDLSVQHTFQLRYGRPPDFLFYYPPFVLLPFLPLVTLPIRAAFVLWTVCSIGLLVAAVRSLSLRMGFCYDNWPILLSAAFPPVACSLGHGQLSIVALAALVWCYALWSDGRRFAGGMVLGLATVKFQLVAGFLCILLLKRKWRELAGFVSTLAPLLVLSDLIVGVPGLLQYPGFMLQCERGPGVHPTMMASLRGLVAVFFGNGSHIAVVVVLSLAGVLLGVLSWKNLDAGFAASTLVTILVSYHLNVQDLSLALIPLFLAIRRCTPPAQVIVVIAALVLPIAFVLDFALLAVPLVGMLLWVRHWTEESNTFDPAI